MNVYKKLQEARVRLQELDLKKSGKNTYSNYKYYELSDFLPEINKLMDELNLSSFINFTSEIATLTIVNVEKEDEQIVFTCPMSSASLKGCHEVQNLGAVQTYLRRYLYTNAFEIVEADALEAITGKKDTKETKSNKSVLATKEEITEFVQTYRKKGITDAEMKKRRKGKSSEGITKDELQKCYKLI